MEINRTGATIFNPQYKLIEVYCIPPVDSSRQPYPLFANSDQDAEVWQAKAHMQGDTVQFVKILHEGKEATRCLYIGMDGCVVGGADQSDPNQ